MSEKRKDVDFRIALPDDANTVLALLELSYHEEGYSFSEARVREALNTLITDPSRGQLWVFVASEEIIGYLAITLGHSLEYCGRDAFIDELFIREDWRGQGIGTQALIRAESICRSLGVNALHLEVERRNMWHNPSIARQVSRTMIDTS